jgi:hypothetical protein
MRTIAKIQTATVQYGVTTLLSVIIGAWLTVAMATGGASV